MNSKKGFIFHYGTTSQMERLLAASGPEAVIELLHIMEDYSLDGTEPEKMDPIAEIIFEGMRRDLDIDRENYNRTVERNRKNAEKRKTSPPEETSGDENAPVDTSGDQSIPVETERRKKKEESREKMEYIDSIDCAEPVIGLPLNDGSEHPVTPEDVAEYSRLYPAVDVMQQLRNMRGWILANPSRRKTKRGIKAFISTWLAKEQDRPRSGTTKRMTAEEIINLPSFNPWTEAAQ